MANRLTARRTPAPNRDAQPMRGTMSVVRSVSAAPDNRLEAAAPGER